MNFSIRRLHLLPGLLLFFTLASCSAQSTGQSAEGKAQTGLETAVISIVSSEEPQRQATVEVELAKTETERNTGLMFRTTLEDGKGMYFIFERDEVLSFWMKNTLVPLSIAFISYDGTIIDIRDMHPNDTRPVQSSRSVRYALEVPQGWFGRTGIKPGVRVSLGF
jgi:uncharacterized membrane protein (UPF0127 family)